FEIALWLLRDIGVIAIARALFVAAIFTAGFVLASRSAPMPVALFLSAIAFTGAHERLDARPSTVAAACVVAAIALHRSRIAYAALSTFWINVHPSALLALANWRAAIFTAIALLINPYGYRAIVAPLELTLFARGGTFVNAEWLPSPIGVF